MLKLIRTRVCWKRKGFPKTRLLVPCKSIVGQDKIKQFQLKNSNKHKKIGVGWEKIKAEIDTCPIIVG